MVRVRDLYMAMLTYLVAEEGLAPRHADYDSNGKRRLEYVYATRARHQKWWHWPGSPKFVINKKSPVAL